MTGSGEIFIAAGEPSGDLIGSLLVSRIKQLNPTINITGLGGDQMAAAGAEIRVNMTRDLAIIGLSGIVAKYPKIRRVFRDTVDYLRARRPDVLVLIDYPGFNLRLTKAAHALGIPVVYYVIPQVWAWHRSRVQILRECVDRALVIFPFEEKLLLDEGAKVEHVGHPLLDVMKITMTREEALKKFRLDPEKKVIGLLPGSRRREVDSLLPAMLGAAELIRSRIPGAQFVLPLASTISLEVVQSHLARFPQVPVTVAESMRYNIRAAMDFAIVASGTATLETGLLLCPMVIVYRVTALNYLALKTVIRIPHVGLINIVAGETIAPELIQGRCTPDRIAAETLEILTNPAAVKRIKARLTEIKESMGGPGASQRAAESVLEIYQRSRGATRDSAIGVGA